MMMSRDKRVTEDEAVATLEDGMTLGIGGWASRRKPMSLVRALLRADVGGNRHRAVTELLGDLLEPLAATGKQRDMGALVEEARDDRESGPARRAGDSRDLPVERAAGQPGPQLRLFTSVKSSRPWRPHSRPRPDCL